MHECSVTHDSQNVTGCVFPVTSTVNEKSYKSLAH